MTLKERALEVAISQLGVEEEPKGSNGGPQVNKYLRSVGLGSGYSWCMAFVYWCFKEAAEKMAVNNPLVKTAGVIHHYNRARPEVKFSYPQPGDIFIMDYGKGLGHTGIVEKVEPDYVHTIEGNTNDEGSREGYEVCRRRRPRSKIKAYLRYTL